MPPEGLGGSARELEELPDSPGKCGESRLEQSGRRPSDSDRAHVLVSPGLPSTVCCCRAVLSRQHVADARAAGRGLVRRRASTACSRFRLRVEYVMVSTLYATGPSGRFPDSSRRYGGSCIAINPSHRDRRRVRTLRCSSVTSEAVLSVNRRPRTVPRSSQRSRFVTTRVDPRDHDIQTCDIGDRAMPGRGPARCRSPSRCPLSCSGPAPAAWVVPIGR